MTDHNDSNDDNDDFTTPPAGADAAGADSREDALNTGESTDTDDASHLDADSSGADNDRADVDLPQLLRQVSHVLGREFRAAAADSGFDPRDFGRGRRGRRGWDHDEAVVDGAPVPEEPVSWGPAWGRGGRGPIGDVSPEEFRRRMRDLRDGIGSKVEEVLSSEEFEELKASLSKIVEAFGPDRCGDGAEWNDHAARHDRPGPRSREGRGDEDPRDRSGRDGRPSDAGRGDHHGRGRGRRGFGPGLGPGFGAGRRGFDPFGWGDDRRNREREVQEAFEREFAAGFEQGRNA